VTPNPQTNLIYKFCVAFHIFVDLGEHRDFKFDVHVIIASPDSQPTDDKLSLKLRGFVTSRDPLQSFIPLKYLWNGLS